MGLSTTNKEKTEFAPIPAGVYNIRLLDITEAQGQYGAYWQWKWEVTDHPYTGRWLWIFTDNNINPKYVRRSGKVGPRDLVAVLTGAQPEEEEFIEGREYENLIGLPAQGAVTIGKNQKDGTPINVLNAVLPPSKGAIGGYEPAQAARAEAPIDAGIEETDLYSKYLGLKRSLDWDTETAIDMIEKWTERKVKFQELSLAEKRLVIQWMDHLAEENDIPMETPVDDVPELTAAGLVSPTAPSTRHKNS